MAEKRLRYAFIGDAKSLVNATRKSDSALGKLTRSVGKIGISAAKGFAVVGTAAVAMGVQALGVASDAEEAGAAFETTFGGAAKKTGEFVEEFANKAGLASFELKQLLATSGAVLQGIDFTAAASAELSTPLPGTLLRSVTYKVEQNQLWKHFQRHFSGKERASKLMVLRSLKQM